MSTATAESVRGFFERGAERTQGRTLLRFSTAGSVDDGKSTLIGRLLYDSQAVYEDQLASVRQSRFNRSGGPIDFSLLTDGLRAEREQGITIDVAYRYFSTPRRKFIIADTPGHEQYTRNMATGVSTADAAVVLIDATKGVLRQSRRHAYITRLLGVPHLIAAVNKMDLVAYSQEVFERIAVTFCNFTTQLGPKHVFTVPISALEGDNVAVRSARTPWFEGPALLDYLESIPVGNAAALGPLRFPVQYVIRPDASFRGFAGQIASGVMRKGARVVALPSRVQTRIKSILTFDGELDRAEQGDSVSVTLQNEIDLSRGDLLTAEADLPAISNRLEAKLIWMNRSCLDFCKDYLLKHTTRTIPARVTELKHRVDVNTLDEAPARTLEMNDIGTVILRTARPLFFDPYDQDRTMGSFILIDPLTNATVAAGIIGPLIKAEVCSESVQTLRHAGRVSAEERSSAFGHSAAAIWCSGRPCLAERLQRALRDDGWHTVLVRSNDFQSRELRTAARAFQRAGVLAIFSLEDTDQIHPQTIRAVFGSGAFFTISESALSDPSAAACILNALRIWRDAQGTS